MGRLLVIASIAAELRLGGVLPTITYGVAYSATLHQVGGTGIASLACASALPTGFTATDNGDGTITFAGTTTDPGDFPITVTGLDADRTPLIANYVLHVQVLPIALSGDAGDQRIGDSDTFSGYGATGGSGTGYVWAVVGGALPPGWGPINSANGHIPRTPTTPGNYGWDIQVTDSLGNVSGVFADSATIRYATITLTGSFAALGIIGVPYSSDITITGGDGTYSDQRFTSGAVSGMALSIVTVSGVKKLRLSGTPTTQETDSITVAVDAHEFDGTLVTATKSQSITEDPALTLTGTFTAAAVIGVAYQSDLLLGGGDGTFALGNGGTGLAPGSAALPGGLALSVVTVGASKYLRLSGNPTTAAANNFTASVDAGDGQNVTSAQSVTVYAALTLTGAFPAGVVGTPYSQFITIAGGSGAYSLHGGTGMSSGSLPAGLSLSIVSSTHLLLSGTPTANATSAFTSSVDSTDGQNATSAQSVQIIIYATLDPANTNSGVLTLSNGNLTVTRTGSSNNTWRTSRATLPKSSGKWYFEIKNNALGGTTGDAMWGFVSATDSLTTYPGNVAQSANSTGWESDNLPDSSKFKGGTGSLGAVTGYGTCAVNAYSYFAIDLTAGKLWVKNSSAGGWAGGGDPATGTTPTFTFTAGATLYAAIAAFSASQAATANFGASAFNGAVPSGFSPGWYA